MEQWGNGDNRAWPWNVKYDATAIGTTRSPMRCDAMQWSRSGDAMRCDVTDATRYDDAMRCDSGSTWIHLDSLRLIWIRLDSLGFTWAHLESHGLTWLQMCYGCRQFDRCDAPVNAVLAMRCNVSFRHVTAMRCDAMGSLRCGDAMRHDAMA